jgi:hypothetical protein
MNHDYLPQDICVTGAPRAQFAIDTIEGWSSRFPAALEVTAGTAGLFEDDRVHWALAQLGGARGKTILELGPLEGGHTYMLHESGAASILAIEGNKRCYLKCLITKELLHLDRARILLGDFMPWLENNPTMFDMIWSTGVLYHQVEPIKLLKLIGTRTNQTHIWTHYIPDEGYGKEPWTQPITAVEEREYNGRQIPHFVRSYFNQGEKANYCGGVYQNSSWLRRSDILAELKLLGFNEIAISFEDPGHPNGPAFAIAASRR